MVRATVRGTYRSKEKSSRWIRGRLGLNSLMKRAYPMYSAAAILGIVAIDSKIGEVGIFYGSI